MLCIVFNYFYLIELYGVIKYLRIFGLLLRKVYVLLINENEKMKNENFAAVL